MGGNSGRTEGEHGENRRRIEVNNEVQRMLVTSAATTAGCKIIKCRIYESLDESTIKKCPQNLKNEHSFFEMYKKN